MSYRAGFVGMIGLPNAGKSTLVNALLGEKIGIISKKPQTTRQKVMGILSADKLQAIFIDTPGYVNSNKGLNNFLEKEFESSLKSSDVLVVLLNLDAPNKEDILKVIESAKLSKKPWLAVITKTDLAQPERKAIITSLVAQEGVPLLEVCALKEVESFKVDLLGSLSSLLPESPAPLYDPELFTPHTEREMVSEIIREKCFEYLHQEVPYGLAVRILSFKDEPALTRLEAEIIVTKANHVSMVIGQGGQTIKRIGASARIEIEKFLDRKVFLKNHVKFKANWFEDSRMMNELGYVTNK